MREDGVIFVTIDDQEVENPAEVLNEIFGEENFVAQCHLAKDVFHQEKLGQAFLSRPRLRRRLRTSRRQLEARVILQRTEEMEAEYQNPDNDPRGPWKAAIFPPATITAKRPTRSL